MIARWTLLLVVPLLAACSAVPTIVVGSDLENEPFAWMDERGVPQGRDVEMMEALGHVLERRIVWKRLPFDELLDAVASGQVDIVCATLGITPERAIRTTLRNSIGVFENSRDLPAVERLAGGTLDAIVMDAPAARALVAAHAGQLTTLDEPLAVEHYALALNKGDTRLLDDVNRELSRFARRGSFLRWNQKHGLISN